MLRNLASVIGHALRQILASNDTTPALAKRFGVNSGTIHDVRVRRTWRHVGD